MPVRQRILPSSECVDNFELVAQEKYEAGFNLLTVGMLSDAVYLMGFTADMLLKSAYFRLCQFQGQQPVTSSDLQNAKNEAKTLGVKADREGYHGLEFWSEMIVKKRRQFVPLDAAFEIELQRHIRTLQNNWSVEMRYLPNLVIYQDAESVFDEVSWVIDNHERLWR